MSTSLHRRRTTAGVLAIGALVLTGCGLKPGATAQIAGARQNIVGTTTGTAPTAADGTVAAPGTTTVDPGTGAVTGTAPVPGAVDPGTGAPAAPGGGSVPLPGAVVGGTVPGGTTGSTGTTGAAPVTGANGATGPTPTTAAKPGTTTTKKPTTSTATKPGTVARPGTGTGAAPGAPGGPGAPVAGPGTRIGINDGKKEIYITIHTPITGAAPVPQAAFSQDSVNLFWKDPAHKVFGYQVIADVVDDTYNPSQARVVCEDAARRSFLVVGGAGTDQIQACATDPVLAQSRTPYFSAGVTTNGLVGLSNYFAYSGTYKDQSPAVLQLARAVNAPFAKCAIVATETPNFDDAEASAEAAFRPACADLKVIRTNKSGSLQDGQATGRDLAAYGPTVTYVNTSPTYWIGIVAGSPTLDTQYVGPGVTMGINTVASSACRVKPTLRAAFLSPSPGLDREPAGFAASGPSTDPTVRDLQLQIYGGSEIFYRALTSLGSIANLNRENVIAALPRFKTSGLSVFPNVDFSAGGGHFGGQGAWPLQAVCANGGGGYRTIAGAPFPL